jgi:hypothetical protein
MEVIIEILYCPYFNCHLHSKSLLIFFVCIIASCGWAGKGRVSDMDSELLGRWEGRMAVAYWLDLSTGVRLDDLFCMFLSLDSRSLGSFV